MKSLNVADLFCGAGGTSSGAIEAIEALGMKANLTAVNHWPVAIETHSQNHPEARHYCASLDSLNPREIFSPGQLDLLWASPECTHHSIARGGKPINDQSRATAWCVVRWAEALMPPVILIENVPEFVTWGGIGANGRPLKSKRGATFAAWVGALESLGYKVGWKVLRADKYGDPTKRRRLFVQAVRGKRNIVWPDPTHSKPDQDDLFGSKLRPWRNVENDVIDWTLKGESIFERKKPLSKNTILRIREGMKKFGGAFLIAMENGGSVRSLAEPINTITTARGGAHAIVEPYIIELRGTSSTAINSTAYSIREPLGTVSAGGRHHALIQPFLIEYYGNGGAEPISEPLNTVTCKHRHALVQPQICSDGKRYILDILFRMLKPHELAAAQGFPKDYKFSGTQVDVVKQIGNAVPRRLARSLVLASVSQSRDISNFISE